VGELPSTPNNLQGPLLVALGEEKSWEEGKIPLPRKKTCLIPIFNLSASSPPITILALPGVVLVKCKTSQHFSTVKRSNALQLIFIYEFVAVGPIP